MLTISAYLDEVKKKAGISTDKELADRLGIKNSAVCHLRSGENHPSDETCKKLAGLAGDPVETVLLLAAESRAPESTRKAWEHILKTWAKASGFVLLAVLWWAGYFPHASTLPLLGASLSGLQTMDIMSNCLPALAALPVLIYSLKKSLYPPNILI